jgi:hypothetical protein
MSIHGTLKTMSIADLLQFLAVGRKTGTLKIARGTIVKEIYLEGGLIVGSKSNDPKELLGQVLLHYGKITEDHLQTGMEIQRQSGGKLGIILAERGFVTADDVMEALRTRTLDIIYDLFIWEEAEFEFFDGQPLPADLIRIQVHATSVIMDGICRIDEWSRFRKVIPSDRNFFALEPGWTKAAQESKDVREVLYHVEKGHTAAEICYHMHTSLYHACEVLFELLSKGVIKVAGEAPAKDATEDLSALKLPETAAELIELATAEMKDNNVENALAIIHTALDREPNNAKAQRLREDVENRYVRQVLANGLSRSTVPRLLANLDDLEYARFGPQEGFLLSRINGEWDIASILSVCPFREADSLRMIKKMIDDGVVGIS